jgi:hypothetical protein
VRRDEAAARALVTGGAAGVIAGAFLPWIASGTVERSSFDMATLVERLGFAEGGAVLLAVRAWSLVPMCATAAVAAAWWGWWRVGAACAATAALYAGAIGVAVLAAPDVALVRVRLGAGVTVAAGAVLLAGAVASGVTARQVNSVTRATRRARPGPA